MLDNEVTAIGQGFGKVYVATDGGGISTLDASGWDSLDTSLVDENCSVTDIAFASSSDVWITTDDNCGLKHIVNDHLVLDSLVFNASLSTVEIDGEGSVWVGNYGNGGLYEFLGNAFISYNEWNSDNPNDYVWGISVINDSTRWVVGTHEVGLMADSGWTVFNYLQNPYPLWWDVVANGNEAAWFATTLGLVHFDGDTSWTVYNETNSGMPPSGGIDDFPDLTLDQNGVIWLASYSGLIKYDGTDFTIYNTSNSDLPSNIVNVVEVDSANNVWVGTENGLVKISPSDPSGLNAKEEVLYSVYPNPSKGLFTINGISWRSEVRVTNLMGEEVLFQPGVAHLDLSEFVAGVYLVEVTEEGDRQVFKLFKN